MRIDHKDHRIQPGERVDLAQYPTKISPLYGFKKACKKMLEAQVDELSELQRLHYASSR